MGQPNSNAELHIQLHLVEEIHAELKIVIDDRPFDFVHQTHKWFIDLLALNLCTAPINYDLPFFSAINHYFFSYFEKEMEKDIAGIFIQKHVSFPLLHFL